MPTYIKILCWQAGCAPSRKPQRHQSKELKLELQAFSLLSTEMEKFWITFLASHHNTIMGQ